jgi:hypothetical protein
VPLTERDSDSRIASWEEVERSDAILSTKEHPERGESENNSKESKLGVK